MIAEDALNIINNPPDHSTIFGRIADEYIRIISQPADVQIDQLDKLQPLLPYVLYLNAARDVGESLGGKDIRDPKVYVDIANTQRPLIATRIREINRMMTEGWIKKGGDATKVKIGGFDKNELAVFGVFLSTYLKALVNKSNAAEYLTHEPVIPENEAQTITLDRKTVELLETARLPQPDLPPRT